MKEIPINRPFLPPLDKINAYLEEIWGRNWLTNDGPLVRELEDKLKLYFDQELLLFTSNGTIAIQMAIKALEITGEVITTPFSYVATTSGIVWENCTPVFADIDPNTFNIDPNQIEKKISPKTTAILATHVFGNPCDIEAIEKIAKANDLKVIYDAAHCFGTTYKGKSVLGFGDISTISFHATKVFHTVEGGAVITADKNTERKLGLLRNFGHDGPGNFSGVGINAKNSEIHAAMGLVNLAYIDQLLEKRRKDHKLYDQYLQSIDLKKPAIPTDVGYNYSYYPVVLESEDRLNKVLEVLNKEGIFPRRYFYPSLNTLDYVNSETMPVSEDLAKRIICLPLYADLSEDEIKQVSDAMIKAHK